MIHYWFSLFNINFRCCGILRYSRSFYLYVFPSTLFLHDNYCYPSRISLCMYKCFKFFLNLLLSDPANSITWKQLRYLSACTTEMPQCAYMCCCICATDRSLKLYSLDRLLSCSLPRTQHSPPNWLYVSLHYMIKSDVARFVVKLG